MLEMIWIVEVVALQELKQSKYWFEDVASQSASCRSSRSIGFPQSFSTECFRHKMSNTRLLDRPMRGLESKKNIRCVLLNLYERL